MVTRVVRPVLRVALLVDRGRVASHYVDARYPAALCGLDRGDAVPITDLARPTCPTCLRLQADPALALWRTGV